MGKLIVKPAFLAVALLLAFFSGSVFQMAASRDDGHWRETGHKEDALTPGPDGAAPVFHVRAGLTVDLAVPAGEIVRKVIVGGGRAISVDFSEAAPGEWHVFVTAMRRPSWGDVFIVTDKRVRRVRVKCENDSAETPETVALAR